MVTAITLALVYLGGAAAYAAFAWHEIAAGAAAGWFIAGAFVVYFGVPALAAAVWFTVAWIWRSPRPPPRQIGLAASVALYASEARAITRNGPRMAFSWWRLRDPSPAPAAAPVLLLHGVLCNSAVWRDWIPGLAARGLGPVYTLSYGPPLSSVELFAEEAAAKIDAILAATGARKVALVGHSMGGLVARAYLRRYGGAKAHCLVTIGTPHHGSMHAWLFPGICLAQMRPGSAWLSELNRDESLGAPAVSIWSWHDSMVAPQTSSRLLGATNIELIGIGHNALLGDPRVFALVAAELERVKAAAAVVSPAAAAAVVGTAA
jgi:predicted alpha/beta hydrolase family esterase